jgi:cellobiose phosphorylase
MARAKLNNVKVRITFETDKGEATVLGHLRRALEFNIERSGAHGLPCAIPAAGQRGAGVEDRAGHA